MLFDRGSIIKVYNKKYIIMMLRYLYKHIYYVLNHFSEIYWHIISIVVLQINMSCCLLREYYCSTYLFVLVSVPTRLSLTNTHTVIWSGFVHTYRALPTYDVGWPVRFPPSHMVYLCVPSSQETVACEMMIILICDIIANKNLILL